MTTTSQEVLGKHTCSACGATRRTTNLRYDPNKFLPYCVHAELCDEGHPNSPYHIIQRGNALSLVTLSEAEKLYKEKLLIEHPDRDAVVQIRKLLEHPISLRLNHPDLAKYLVNVKKTFQFPSMADTLRYILITSMENGNNFSYVEQKAQEVVENKKEVERIVEQEVKPQPEPEPIVESQVDEDGEDWEV